MSINHDKDDEKSYYDVLGVRSNASYQQIKNAFNKKALQYHPDKQTIQSFSTMNIIKNQMKDSKFLFIQEAYSILKDVLKRKEYDQKLQTLMNQRQQLEEPLIYEDIDLDDMDFDEPEQSYFKSCPRCQSIIEESGLCIILRCKY
jgi:DnaJ-class molecular chaperone